MHLFLASEASSRSSISCCGELGLPPTDNPGMGRDIPAWAVTPRQTGMLLRHVTADGIIKKYSVDAKSAYTFGRNEQACDFGVDHKSVSRVHACLAHHASGGVYLLDLGSRHGVYTWLTSVHSQVGLSCKVAHCSGLCGYLQALMCMADSWRTRFSSV